MLRHLEESVPCGKVSLPLLRCSLPKCKTARQLGFCLQLRGLPHKRQQRQCQAPATGFLTGAQQGGKADHVLSCQATHTSICLLQGWRELVGVAVSVAARGLEGISTSCKLQISTWFAPHLASFWLLPGLKACLLPCFRLIQFYPNDTRKGCKKNASETKPGTGSEEEAAIDRSSAAACIQRPGASQASKKTPDPLPKLHGQHA